jgi:hypothetical protein
MALPDSFFMTALKGKGTIHEGLVRDKDRG